MKKDIAVLLGTTNEEIFEEQAKNWPGIETFRSHGWKCVCDEPDCFRFCVQSYGSKFPSSQLFEQFLEEIAGIKTREELERYIDDFAERAEKGKRVLH